MPGKVNRAGKILTATLIGILLFITCVTDNRLNACTSFYLNDKTDIVFGRNFDFYTGIGYVMVNKRNLLKTALVQPPNKPVKWTSKYGSITFNQLGKEFPYGGINEKGLVVAQLMYQETQFSNADKRPALGELQWIQYQLDTAATVQDVIESGSKIRITRTSVPLHFLVGDRQGNAVVIDHINGKLIQYSGKNLPFKVLSNDSYEKSVKYFKNIIKTWKTDKIPASYGVNDRFARAANMIIKYKKSKTKPAVEYAFDILNNVKQPHTRYSIVYDIKNMTIHYKTEKNPILRRISVKDFDYTCDTPSLAINLDKNITRGKPDFEIFTLDLNKKLISRVFDSCDFFRNRLRGQEAIFSSNAASVKCSQ